MKQYKLLGGVLALIFAAITGPLHARGDESTDRAYGVNAPTAAATRQISINSDTKWVEVKEGEVVQFLIGDKSFSWQFNGDVTLSEIDLNKIAPSGLLNHAVEVYIDHLPANYRG